MAVATALAMLPALPTYAKNLEWEEIDGKKYWYENDVKMGVFGGAGNVWYDGTERGKEIYDPGSDAWYWLDTNADGAKAEGKEVFMPYVYGNESEMDSVGKYNLAYESNTAEENLEHAKLGFQISNAMASGAGKWVRYDGEGRMMKGWVTIQGDLEAIYPDQVGNIYYYDRRTGVMAKGIVEIDGKHYSFDRQTGALIGETDELTDEEQYNKSMEENSGKTLNQIFSETVYQSPREDDHDYRSEYIYDEQNSGYQYNRYTKRDGEYVPSSEAHYQLFKWTEGTSSWSSYREVSRKSWSYDLESKKNYLFSESEYKYDDESLMNYGYTYSKSTYYNVDGTKSSVNESNYAYDDGNKISEITEYTNFDSDGEVSSKNKYENTYKYENGNMVLSIVKHYNTDYESGELKLSGCNEIVYNYDGNGNLIEEVATAKPVVEGGKERIFAKTTYSYDENNCLKESKHYSSSSKYEYNEETAEYEYKYELVLDSVTRYEYKKFGENWRQTLYETYDVQDGEITDVVKRRTISDYNSNGSTVLTESYNLVNNKLQLNNRSTYEYTADDYTIKSTYRSYTSDSTWNSTEQTYIYSDPYLVSGNDRFYIDVPDSTYYRGYRHTSEKIIYYVDEDKDGQEEVDYRVEYDTAFTWDVSGLDIGEEKQSITKAYNADGSEYYTTTDIYRVMKSNY